MKLISEKHPKITRQISVVALGLVSTIALLLSTGLIMFAPESPDPGDIETYTEVAPPLFDPNNQIFDPVQLEPPPSIDVSAGNSPALIISCVLVVLGFVLVWFLVFRPEDDVSESPFIERQEPLIE